MSSAHRPTTRIYAHRGGSLLAPENTQTAFDLALEYGTDVLETDVRISADNHIIVAHDATVDRTTNGSGLIRGQTLSELKRLDAGYRARAVDGKTFRGTGVELLTLDELFERYPAIPINIDIKDNNPQAARLVAECIQRHDRTDNVVVGSFHDQIILQFRILAPQVKTAAVQREVARLYLQHLPGKGASASVSYSAVQIPTSWRMIPLATQRFVNHVQSIGKEICYWTINDPAHMRKLLLLGANGIVTDRPDIAQQIFNECGHNK